MLPNKMIDSFKVNESISNISFLLKPETVISNLNNSSKQILQVSSKGKLVKSEFTSDDAIKQFGLWLVMSLTNSNESLSVYSLIVKHLSKGTKNLAQTLNCINSWNYRTQIWEVVNQWLMDFRQTKHNTRLKTSWIKLFI